MACNYRVQFAPERPLSERVLFPVAPDESHGVEDARLTLFVEDTGESTYYGTYTAFDGVNIAPRLIQTQDFQNFDISQLIGPAAKNKGMAIFPRRVDGRISPCPGGIGRASVSRARPMLGSGATR